jgi:hypothetical protein
LDEAGEKVAGCGHVGKSREPEGGAARPKPFKTANAREALAEAEEALAQARGEQEQAKADYTHWFQSDRRAKIWLGIDVKFGKVVG